MKPAHLRICMALISALVLSSCTTTNNSLDSAKQQLRAGDTQSGLASLENILRTNPEDREARALYLRQRDAELGKALSDGETALASGKVDEAERHFRYAQRLDPRNQRALDALTKVDLNKRSNALLQEVKAALTEGKLGLAESKLRLLLADNPTHRQAKTLLRLVQDKMQGNTKTSPEEFGTFAQPISLEFRDAPIRSVFEALSKVSGINFVLDSDVKPDIRVTIFVKQTAIDEVVKLILATNQLERKLLNERSILIYPKIPAKLKDYQDLEARSFFLANVDAKQAMNLVKTVVKSKDIFIDEKRNMIVIRDTPDALQLVERLFESLDIAEPEVMLEVEVLEVSRNRLRDLGMRFPDQFGYGMLAADGTLSTGLTNLYKSSQIIPYTSNPALLLNLRVEDGDTNLLANPRIRVKNMEKAKIHIGDKLPVFTTTSTANVGVSAAVNYLDVGLKLEVEPTIYLKDEVGIRIGMEVSSVTKSITGPQGSLAYQIGNRSAATALRLKDGETQILAGLISDEERSSANKLPGLGEIPVVGRLFSNRSDTRNKTEIVLLITPRIIRNLPQPSPEINYVDAGTEGSIGSPPLRLRNTASGSLGLSSRSQGGASPAMDNLIPPDIPLPEIPLPVVPPPVPVPVPPPTNN